MTFKGPIGFGRIVNICMNIVMCAALSFYVLFTVQNIPGNEMLPILTPLGFFVSFVQSFAVGMTVGDLVPAIAWGNKLAAAMRVTNRVATHLISVVVLALVMVTSISFICTWLTNVQTMGMEGVMASWLMVYPVLLVGGYVILATFLIPAMKLAAAISGFDPAKAAPPAPAAE
jgi:hypothetical protein